MLLDLLWQSKIDDKSKTYFIICGMLLFCCLVSFFSKGDKENKNEKKGKKNDENMSVVMFGTFVIVLFLYYQYR